MRRLRLAERPCLQNRLEFFGAAPAFPGLTRRYALAFLASSIAPRSQGGGGDAGFFGQLNHGAVQRWFHLLEGPEFLLWGVTDLLHLVLYGAPALLREAEATTILT